MADGPVGTCHDSSGNVVATGYMQGIGLGPQVSFLPSAESTTSTSALSSPSGVAVDGSGNIYIADTYNQRVLKETLSAGSYTESVLPTSSLSYPYGIAVDGSGIIYIADTGNNRVLKETPTSSGYTEGIVQSSPLNNPFGVAVDGRGDVYIADTYNNRILLETPSSGGYVESALTTSALNSPFGVAVDGGGNVYIADSYNSRVLKEVLGAGDYREITLPTSAIGPFGLAVDAVGNVYISNYYTSESNETNSDLLKETFSSGSYTESIVQTSTLNAPFGVAADGVGNVYIADTGNNRVLKEDFADPPSLSFALTAPGAVSGDSPQTITLQNAGNGPLTFPVLGGGNNPNISANFTLNTSGATICPMVTAGSATSGTLAAGQSCILSIDFAPTATGLFNGSLTLTDTALNAVAPAYATQAIALSGTGTGSTPQTITFASIPAQYINSTLTTSATASSGLAVSFTSTTPAICTVSGASVSMVGAGTCIIQANQWGSTVYAAAPTVTQSFAVNLQPQTITFAAIPTQAFNTAIEVPLSASASSWLPISFTSITPAICTISVDLNGRPDSLLLSMGICTIQASQAGDGVQYAAAPIVTQSFTVQSVNLLGTTSFGSVNMGSTSSATSVPLTFNTAGTLGSVSVVSEGAAGLDFADTGTGSCTVGTGYNVGDTCTENVTFTPTATGSRFGAATLIDGSGNLLGTTYLQGTGIGPQVSFLPGTANTVASGSISRVAGVAVDGSGNIYIADQGNDVVWKETLSSGSYTQSILPSSSLSGPQGVAVDGNGNVYIADTYNKRVLKETFSSGNYTESTIPSSLLANPQGVAVDGTGNVYIADTYNNRVLIEMLSGGSYTEVQLTTTSGPTGVAADGNGNVYITNGRQALKESYSAGSYTESILPIGSEYSPDALAVDGNGNVYVAESGTGTFQVLKLTPEGSVYVPTSVVQSNYPSGIAVDSSGNVYVSSAVNRVVLKEDLADPPSLTFALTTPGLPSSDSPQTVTVQNIGNATLKFPIPSSGSNPSVTANFSFGSGGASECPLTSSGSSTAGTLAAGRSCLLPVSFTPTASGVVNGTLTLTDNALYAAAPGYATQTVQLSGSGQGSTSQTITFPAISPQTVGSTVSLSATASSGLPVIFSSSTPAICTVYGSIYVTLPASGTCIIQANQPGNTSYAVAPTVTQNIMINLLPQTITFGPITTQALNSPAPVALAATASSGLLVSFISTTPTTCSVSGSTATLLADGTCTIQATQPGNGTYYAAASPVTQSFTIATIDPLASTSFGSINIGSTSSARTVNITFSAAATLGSVSLLTQGAVGLDFANTSTGTCSVGSSYNAGDSCTVAVTFTPALSGVRYGAVVVADGSGNVLATSYLQGMGTGPQVNFLPGTESIVPNSATYRGAVAVDASGNVYIADTYNQLVLKETLSNGSYTESTIPTSALYNPYGLAVDGAGNIYIADSGNNRILIETPLSGSYSESTLSTSTLNGPESVAVDGSGNVYVADSGNKRILIETRSAGGYIESTLPNSADLPTSVAVDSSGNVYIADSGNNSVLKETLSTGSYTESTLPFASQNSPRAVALDGNGNVYIAQMGYNANGVVIFTLSGGSYIENTVPSSALSSPSGLAVDGSGNVYVSDFYSQVLKEDLADGPSLTFAQTEVGLTSSDSPQIVTVENLGNTTLNFSVPSSGVNPSVPANFAVNPYQPYTCAPTPAGASSGATLVIGQSCVLGISFSPTEGGIFTPSLVLTDNAHNATAPGYATQSIQLNGAGLQPAATPTYSIPSGTYLNVQTVVISDSTSGVTIYYTSDGTMPSTSSAVYSGPITVSSTETLEAIAIGAGYSSSAVGTAVYTITLPAATPTFSPSAGTYSTAQTVTIGDSTPSATIYYTTDGTTPTSSSPIYTSQVTVSTTGILEAVAIASGYSISTVGTAAYTIGTQPLIIPAAGLIGTVAGNGTQGYIGDSGQATNAELNSPHGMAVDSAGNIYIVDSSNNVIRKVSASTGIISTVSGNGTQGYSGDGGSAISAALNGPVGVAVDTTGNLYIADLGNNVIREVSASTGIITTVVGASGNYWGGYSGDGGPATDADLSDPAGVSVDSAGNIYIADTFNNVIRKVSASTGIITTVAGNGIGGYSGDGEAATSAELSLPMDVQVDSVGNIYIADYDNQVIRQVSASTGVITTVAGNGTSGYSGDGGIATSATLVGPVNLAVDAAGNIYLSDSGNNAIRKVTNSTGIITTVAGNGGQGYSGDGALATAAQLNSPAGVVAAPAGNFYSTNNLYFVDSGNNVVRAVGGYRVNAPTFSPIPATYAVAQTVTISDTITGATIYYTTDGTTPTTSSPAYSGPITVNSTETLNAIAVTSTGLISAVGTAPYSISQVTPVVNFASGFTSTNLNLVNDASIVDGVLQLTDGNASEERTAWFGTPVSAQAFTSDFDYQASSALADGLTFALQNDPSGLGALGDGGEGLGYGGIESSVAIKFDLYNNVGEGANSTGLYVNGASPTLPSLDMTASGVILRSGDLMHVHVTYDGATLTWTITDTVTDASFSASAPINIPAIVGGNTAYAGFTGSTGAFASIQSIANWTYIQ